MGLVWVVLQTCCGALGYCGDDAVALRQCARAEGVEIMSEVIFVCELQQCLRQVPYVQIIKF